MLTDPIADYLTRIRNANMTYKSLVFTQHSKTKEEITKILVDEGYIKDYKVKNIDKVKKEIVVTLKFKGKDKVIQGIKRISKPGLRVYVQSKKMPRVLNGLGIAIISTSNGIMTDRKARENKLGGEIIAYVW